MEQKKEIKTSKSWKKVVNIILNVLFYIFIFMLLVFSISNLKGKKENIPNLFGTGYMNVLTDSMNLPEGKESKYDDSFKKGDLIFVKMPTDKRIEALKVGDIITFKLRIVVENMDSIFGTTSSVYSKYIGKSMTITHRIVDIKTTTDGSKAYIVQGDRVLGMSGIEYDKNNAATFKYIQTVSSKDIKGIYSGKWSGAGKTLEFLQTPTGFGIFIVLPTLLLLAFEGVVLFKNIKKLKEEKNPKKTSDISDEERARIKKELLEEIKKEEKNKLKE